MSETSPDRTIISMDEMLNNFSSASSKPSMFRVSDYLRSTKPEAYDPEIIAIGPIHRGKDKLQKMEQDKVRYLKLLLERRGESSVERHVTTIRPLEAVARRCYAEDIDLFLIDFVQMLILDGCFIIEFLHKFQYKDSRDEDDPIFQYVHIQSHLLHDLMVFENQIPFFIIDTLFQMIYNGVNIKTLIWPLLQNTIFPVKDLPPVPDNAQHLLGIVHDFQCSSFARILSLSHMDSGYSDEMKNINSAVELKEAGISFKRSEGNSFFHIEFKNKAMIIPEWEVSDSTESLIRNLIAYEYYLCLTATGTSPQKYITDYVFFMHCLVQSPKDAKLLRHSGIISNFLGSDEVVYGVINQLGKNSIISNKFSYSNIFKLVNRHYLNKKISWMETLRTWMEILRRVYFNNPWTTISVFAGITLLTLTITQTAFAILSYRNDLKKGN